MALAVDETFTQQLADIINGDARLAGLFETREPNWRYFDVGRSMSKTAKRGFPMFAWETEKGADGKYSSWVWQPNANGWNRTKSVGHSKRKSAKARALKMRDSYRMTNSGEK